MTYELSDIEKLTTDYRRQYDTLAERVQRVFDEYELIRRRLMPGIKSAHQRMVEAQDRLTAAIESSPKLFEKPKTQTIAGIRVGLRKQKGKVVFADETASIRLIRKKMPDQADVLIKSVEQIILTACAQLSAQELKAIGGRVTDSTDEVVIKPVDGAIEKLVKAMIKEAQDWAEAA